MPPKHTSQACSTEKSAATPINSFWVIACNAVPIVGIALPVLARIAWAKSPIKAGVVLPKRVAYEDNPAYIRKIELWGFPSGLMTSAKWWDSRYAEQQPGDELWGDSKQIAEAIQAFGTPGGRVLEVGGGGANLSVILASSGFSVISIDIAETIADQMSQRYPQQQWPNLTFLTADVLSLRKYPTFQPSGFDIVVDKGGIHDLALGPEAVARSFDLPRRVVQKLTSQIKLSGGQLFLVSRYSDKVDLGSECQWQKESPVHIHSCGNGGSFIHIAYCFQVHESDSLVPGGEQPLVLTQINTPLVGFETNMPFFVLANVLKDCMRAFLDAFSKCEPLRSVSNSPEVRRLLKEVRMAFQSPHVQRQRLGRDVAPDVHAWLLRSRLALQSAHCPVSDDCAP
eukprot:gnl/MRDRNA2_/MRDRNA2_133809_c0_seq1.p1 gnl/MRDRNA2_/MRDRNA2_133809_c0~~gnl/MRDRNA2_/MRDRNA2_133809_c0_seq1.p1  ORF type:complete len:409 (+),score=50.50 gnl/MRDRNA2_/MRDRNA2_133809_c0_seq1:38-1228(+)